MQLTGSTSKSHFPPEREKGNEIERSWEEKLKRADGVQTAASERKDNGEGLNKTGNFHSPTK